MQLLLLCFFDVLAINAFIIKLSFFQKEKIIFYPHGPKLIVSLKEHCEQIPLSSCWK